MYLGRMLFPAFLVVLIAATTSCAIADSNLALTATASATSENPLYPVAGINDGDELGTGWAPAAGQEPDSAVTLTWDSAQEFSRLIVKEVNRGYLESFRVEVLRSDDDQPPIFGPVMVSQTTPI